MNPYWHMVEYLGQPQQACPKDVPLPKGFVDDPAPKPAYLPGVKTAKVPGQAAPPPAPAEQDTAYAPKENRFLPITIAALVVRGIIALVRRVP